MSLHSEVGVGTRLEMIFRLRPQVAETELASDAQRAAGDY